MLQNPQNNMRKLSLLAECLWTFMKIKLYDLIMHIFLSQKILKRCIHLFIKTYFHLRKKFAHCFLIVISKKYMYMVFFKFFNFHYTDSIISLFRNYMNIKINCYIIKVLKLIEFKTIFKNSINSMSFKTLINIFFNDICM